MGRLPVKRVTCTPCSQHRHWDCIGEYDGCTCPECYPSETLTPGRVPGRDYHTTTVEDAGAYERYRAGSKQ